jgi:dihydrofolate reductase
MKVISIAAVAKNGVIGKGNALPWNIPEDMKFFRESTKNQIVIMGRKTLESLGKPLPHRINVVISRNPDLKEGFVHSEHLFFFDDLKKAIEHFRSNEIYAGKNIFIIGGAQIYELAFQFADELWLTEIDSDFEGDVYFPLYSNGKLQNALFEIANSIPQRDDEVKTRYFFNRFVRKK